MQLSKSVSLITTFMLCSSSVWGYGTSKSQAAHDAKLLGQDTPTVANDLQLDYSAEEPEEVDGFFEEIKFRGKIGIIYNGNSSDEYSDNSAIEGYSEFSKSFDSGTLTTNIALLYDFDDSNRRYFILNELYYKIRSDNSTWSFGRSIKNWGVMEAYSISDVFNTKNYLSDSFDMSSKLGALSAEYTYRTEDAKFSMIAKLEEVEQNYPGQDNLYNYRINPYDGRLKTEKSRHRPTVYLTYDDSYYGDIQVDYSLILQNGYDNKRYFTLDPTNTLDQNAYLVNKVLGYTTITSDNSIYKFEMAYTDVISDPTMSDYMHMGLGIEYLPTELFKGSEVRLLLEYYRYDYFDDSKLKNQDLSEMFDNDIFGGVQSTFGDSGTSDIKAGILYDINNQEKTFILTFGTRMKQNYRLSMEWFVLSPGKETETAIGQIGQVNQVTFRANYFF